MTVKEEDDSEILHITAWTAIGFVISASTFLVLLYFFMSTWFVWLLILLFCLGGIEVFTFVLSSKPIEFGLIKPFFSWHCLFMLYC